MAGIRDMVDAMLEPIRERVMTTISRGIIEQIKKDPGVQLAKASFLAGENRDDLELFQHFGFTSNPPVGSEGIAAFVSGNRDHGILIATEDRRVRFKPVEPGECAIYTDDGTVIHLKKSGNIDIKASTKITVECPASEFSGAVLIKGKLTVENDAQVDGALNVDGNIDSGGNIGATGSVTAGTAVSGATVSGGTVSGGTVATSGGTDLDSIKTAYNGHTHPPSSTDVPSTSIP